jgi:hypothetical protein
MVVLVVILTAMVGFDLAALRWGADSRPPVSDKAIRSI